MGKEQVGKKKKQVEEELSDELEDEIVSLSSNEISSEDESMEESEQSDQEQEKIPLDEKEKKPQAKKGRQADSNSASSNQKNTKTEIEFVDRDENILPYFYDLVSVSVLDRSQTVFKILDYINLVQSKWKLTPESKENTQSPQLRYVLKRLLNGLESTRECARQGFSAALEMVTRITHSNNTIEIWYFPSFFSCLPI